MKQILKGFRDRFLAGIARQQDIDRLYCQLDGLLQIQNAMSGQPVAHALGGWAMSADAMACILKSMQDFPKPTVIEFGSGQSTLIFAAVLKHRGGRLISVEHDRSFSEGVQRRIASCGLESIVEFVVSPITESLDEPSIRSYDIEVLPKVRVDVALIDGPPKVTGPLTRYIPMQWAIENLNPGGMAFLDDAARPSEQECVRKLVTSYRDVVATELLAEKGLVELRRRRQD